MKITDLSCHIMSIPNAGGTGVARRPELGVELNMDIVASRSGHAPLELECCVTADGSNADVVANGSFTRSTLQ